MKTTYRTAVHDAMRDALRDDPRVVLMGEDVGRYGGTYAASKGLLEEFGPERVRDTPLSELGFVGIGIGAALGGLRPIVEVMTVNFSLLGPRPDRQYRCGAAAYVRRPVLGSARRPDGHRGRAGSWPPSTHTAWSAGMPTFPGIKVVAPATVADAYGMLGTALADPDPVVIFEHVQLYNTATDVDDLIPTDISRAAIRRRGSDVTVITYGGCLPKTLDAANELSLAGIDCEVIDLRVLRPLDTDTIIESVRKTHRAVIVDEAWRTGSLAAEISARIVENAFFDLDAPIARVCSAEVPMPYAKHLEQAALPQPDKIVAAVKNLFGERPMIEFKMPALGSDMDEGTLNEWLVKPGDTVTRGQVVAVVETTKAAVEVECWHDGTVQELLVPIGETVQVGTPLATLLAPGETAEAAPDEADRTPPKHPRPSSRRGRRPDRPAPAAGPSHGAAPRRWVSPAARRIAASLGVDVDTVTGTGPQGAVTINDVEHAAASAKKPATKPTAADRAVPDAQVHRGGDEPVEAGDSALLPGRRDTDGEGADLAGRAQRAAVDHRAGAAGGAAAEGRRARGATLRRVQRVLAGRRVPARLGGSRRCRDLAARRRPRRAGHPRCRRQEPRRIDGQPHRSGGTRPRRARCAVRRCRTRRSPSPTWVTKASTRCSV